MKNIIRKQDENTSVKGIITTVKKIYSFRENIVIDLAAVVATSLFIIAGMLTSLNRFWQYETFYYNFGVFDEAIWHVSQFQPPVIEHLLVGGKLLFADHFDISILLLAPVYWITDRSEALLIIQALFAGLSGYVIYKIGVAILKDKLFALSIACCYFFFVGIQNAVITDFQEITIMTLPLSLTILAVIKKRVKLFWLLFLITLGFKEVTFLLGIGIAIFIFLYNREWKKHAFLAMVYSILWGLLTIKVFIPYFSQGVYLHWPNFPDGINGKLFALVDHPLKRQTLYYSFLQFGFLPLFAPNMWFAILQDYSLRFLPRDNNTYWTLGFHYNATASVLLAIGSIFGYANLLRFKLFKKLKYIIALLLFLNAFILYRFVLHGPFLLATNPIFYKHTSDFTFLNDMISKVPKDASVMTQNNLAVRFDHQKFIYLRPNYNLYSPDYVVLDNRPGQSPNDFLFAPELSEFIKTLQQDKNYITFYHNGDQYIFKHID